MTDITHHINGRRVLVLGCGQSGKAALECLARSFQPALVGVADERPAEAWIPQLKIEYPDLVLYPGETVTSHLHTYETLIVSPGFRPDHPWLSHTTPRQVIMTEIDLGFSVAPPGVWIGITGTNGKTTATQWLAELLNHAGARAIACGNIGQPLSRIALSARPGTVYVVEVSSFQLYWSLYFHPNIGILLNIDRDHLDWHGTRDDYVKAKMRLFRHQTPEDFAILNLDETHLYDHYRTIRSKRLYFGLYHHAWPGIGFDDPWITLFWDRPYLVAHRHHFSFRWSFLFSNLMATLLAALLLRVDLTHLRPCLPELKPPLHRLQWVARIENVDYFDDSKATNIHAVRSALYTLNHPKIVLIAGGLAKGQDFTLLTTAIRERVRAVILMGESASMIAEQWRSTSIPIHMVESMEAAVESAAELARPGDAVLLSPGCASFDMFRDYAHRGDCFQAAVNQLSKREPLYTPEGP